MERSRQTASEPPRSESPFPGRSTSGERPAHAPTGHRVEGGPLRAVDWFLPESATLPDHDALRRARLTISVSFVAGCTVLATLIAATDQPDSWKIRLLSYALGLLLVATPLAFKAGVPVRWLGHGVVAIMAGYALSLAGATGGRDTGGFFLAMLTPLPAVLLLGRRAGTYWAVGLALGMGALATAFQLGAQEIVSPLQSEVARWSFWGCIAGIAGTCGVASIYESLQARTLARLVEAKRLADREHERRLELEAGFRADLERLVEERTRELRESREQLRHADRLASIGTLAAGVAHQINNPVGAILLGSELALSDDDAGAGEERYRETLERIRIDAERCGEIVRNLLRFSRRAVANHDDLDLNEVLERAIETLGTSGRQVELVRSGEALPLLANAIELEQVILNLVTNAVQSGAETISVSARRVQDEAQLEVADDGCGIREDDRDRVFDPFFTTRPTEGGTGLGLSMAHRIVEDHGGRIGVDSKPGRGTRFFVSLPLRGESCEP
ncbi:MAG: HAMP domain-containing histidine kinase [bacterium]|nr:HAMP domain-containing histidine kinase [bacterium]